MPAAIGTNASFDGEGDNASSSNDTDLLCLLSALASPSGLGTSFTPSFSSLFLDVSTSKPSSISSSSSSSSSSSLSNDAGFDPTSLRTRGGLPISLSVKSSSYPSSSQDDTARLTVSKNPSTATMLLSPLGLQIELGLKNRSGVSGY